MNPCKHATYPALVVLMLLAGSAAYAEGEEPSSAEVRAEVNLLRREVARLRAEVDHLRKALAAIRGPLAEVAPTETPQAPPPKPKGAPAPGSVEFLLASIPAKFMPLETKATAAQLSALRAWLRENLGGEKVRVRMKVNLIASEYLYGYAVGPFLVHERLTVVKVRASFGDAKRDDLLPLAEGMTVEVSGTVFPGDRRSSSVGLEPTDVSDYEEPLKRSLYGWVGEAAAFHLFLVDCSIVAGPAAAAP